jgi:hypothetical protein
MTTGGDEMAAGAGNAGTGTGAAGGAEGGGRRARVVLVDDHRMFRTGVRAEIGQT